jgi:copper chaperone CopZ
VEGVTDINVSLEENKATVKANPDKIQAMIDAITAEDYEVTEVINAQ